MGAIPQPLPALLQGQEVLFRVLKKRKWLDEKLFAFLIEERDRDSGLSVSFNWPAEEAEARFDSCGVRSLVAQQVDGLGLPVVPDEPTHANIKNIPYRHDEGRELDALRIAEALLSISDVVIERTEKKKKTEP
jgi:hypothetical protein